MALARHAWTIRIAGQDRAGYEPAAAVQPALEGTGVETVEVAVPAAPAAKSLESAAYTHCLANIIDKIVLI